MLTPRPYQEEGIQFFLSHPRCILGDDPGTGKTMQSLLACDELIAHRVLIVCPNTMKFVWRDEIIKWLPGHDYQVVDGEKNLRLEQLRRKVDFLIVSYELARIHEKELAKIWDVVILDEAHRVKNRQAKTTKALLHVTHDATRIFELTGTPVINHASELFSLLQILFPRDFTSYWRFADEFCNVINNGFGWEAQDILDPNHPKVIALQTLLKDVMLRRRKDDVLGDLPPKTIQQVPVTLTPIHQDMYKQMQKQMIIQLSETETIAPVTVLSLLSRLRQMAIDPTLMLEGVSTPLTGAKVDTLLDLINDTPGQVVVFSQYSRVIKRLGITLDIAKITHTGFTGEDSTEIRRQALDSFRTDPSIRVFLVTIGAGGQGVSLATASTAIFVDKAWSPAYNIQAQDRLHRIPQTQPVLIYELVARHTVEAKLERMLTQKASLSRLLIDQPRTLFEETA